MADLAGRWSGIALAAGAILLGVGLLMASFSPASAPPSQRTSAFLLISTILVMLALPAVYARQANAAGLLGLLAHILLEVGLVFLLVYAAAPLLYRSLNEPPGDWPNCPVSWDRTRSGAPSHLDRHHPRCCFPSMVGDPVTWRDDWLLFRFLHSRIPPASCRPDLGPRSSGQSSRQLWLGWGSQCGSNSMTRGAA